MNNIIPNLNDLSKEELELVQDFINQFADKKIEKKRKQHRRKNREEEGLEPRNKRKQKRKHKKEFDIEEHRRERSRGRQERGSQAIIQSVDTKSHRDNLFFSKGWSNLEKDIYQMDDQAKRDRIITEMIKDKSLKVTERDRVSTIEVQCSRCKSVYDVSPKCVYRDGGKYIYICDNCIK